jgi:exodeoxyribonuclease VIII
MSVKPGMYEEILMDEYQAEDAITRSDLIRLLRSPSHYKYRKALGDVDKPCYRLGRAVHASQLEGVPPAINIHDGRSKVGKEFQKENPDAIKPDENEILMGINRSLEDFDWGSDVEQSFFWNEGELLCKCRTDAIIDGYVWDLKTTRRIADKFFWDIKDYRYDIQAVWYLRGVQQHIPVCGFRFLVIELEPPHDWMIYELDDTESAERDVDNALDLYRLCKKTDTWPGYNPQVRRI